MFIFTHIKTEKMNEFLNQLKALEAEAWKNYKQISFCFPIEKRTEEQEFLIREQRARWACWSKAVKMLMAEMQNELIQNN